MSPRPFVPPDLTDLELDVMDVVWDHGEATVRDVMEALNTEAAKPRAYTTYMTVVHRLDSKGLLERQRDGKTDRYRARLGREQFQERRVRDEVGALLGKYGDVALAHFAREVGQLDPARRRALRRLGGKD